MVRLTDWPTDAHLTHDVFKTRGICTEKENHCNSQQLLNKTENKLNKGIKHLNTVIFLQPKEHDSKIPAWGQAIGVAVRCHLGCLGWNPGLNSNSIFLSF